MLTGSSDAKFKSFMDDIVQPFLSPTGFDAAFKDWFVNKNSKDRDNYSTRAFLMAGPQDQGAPNP